MGVSYPGFNGVATRSNILIHAIHCKFTVNYLY